MDQRGHSASDRDKAAQPLSDHELDGVSGGLALPAGLGGPDTRNRGAAGIGSMKTITVGGSQSPALG